MARKALLNYKIVATMCLLFVTACKTTATVQPEKEAQTTTTAQTINTATKDTEGAWLLTNSAATGQETVMLVRDGFVTVAVFDQQNRKFIGTYGGTYATTNGQLTLNYEFNTFDSTRVGTTSTGTSTIASGNWQTSGLSLNAGNQTWEKINEQNSNSPLAGTWRITGRERNGQMTIMRPGPRKTYKVLSDTRFQWIAFNSETGEFSGTGGGTYTAQNGKYTETIEFFSRDSSRVGMQLSFNYEVKDGKWHHTGQSSTGNKVNEIWERITEK